MTNNIKCYRCFITLERLKKDKICDFLIKIIKSDGEEDHICPVCLEGW